MNYLSVCSGIEAATVAWHPLGWKPVAFSEIERFPSEVLKHHYPDVPNVGDMTKFKEWNFESSISLLVGGTPCQSFSIAGLRKGLDDPRGNLMLTYLAIANQYRPKWLVWENVIGVLSSNGGLDFASLLRGMGECGYGFAYRVLDAQYFGVAQRRKRVFLVASFGDWRSAAAVLFERHSLQRNSEPSRETRQSIATGTEECFGRSNSQRVYENHPTDSRINEVSVCPTVTARWGTGGNNVPYTLYDLHQVTSPQNSQNRKDGDPCHTLAKENAHRAGLIQKTAVRRLTPVECERLQGFPDNYTDIKSKGKATPDGPRYKALGNSMAVPVMAWIGKRIQEVENIECKPNK